MDSKPYDRAFVVEVRPINGFHTYDRTFVADVRPVNGFQTL
jgi:hypothetical protein